MPLSSIPFAKRLIRVALSVMVLSAGLLNVFSPHVLAQSLAQSTNAVNVYALPQLITEAKRASPLLQVANEEVAVTQAGVTSAAALPNPELEWGYGRLSSRMAGVSNNTASGLSITQAIENPQLRQARVAVAERRVLSSEAQRVNAEVNLVATVRQLYWQLIRAMDEQRAAQEDLILTEQIREKTGVRVKVGESARFDLVRADNELAVARKNRDLAQARVQQAVTLLRLNVNPSLPEAMVVAGQLNDAVVQRLDKDAIQRYQQDMLNQNPELLALRHEISRAEQQIAFEKANVTPAVSVKYGHDRDPDWQQNRVGIQIKVPLFDRRTGPIEEARRSLLKTRFAYDTKQIELQQQFDNARQRYFAAVAQVDTLEKNIMANAQTAVNIAEAAYRFGERGILEYLDAQRSFRAVRNELIAARADVIQAQIELERLTAVQMY